MDASAFDLGEKLNNRSIRFLLYKPLWDVFKYPQLDLKFSNWKTIKYLNDDGTAFSNEINMVPNKKGGLYLFYIKCQILEGITEYPLYIGRAQLTTGQNLRKRVKEYFQIFARNDERPKITRMFNYWASELHLAYYTLNENDDIIDLERDIINSTLFQMNDRIPDKKISEAIKAFTP